MFCSVAVNFQKLALIPTKHSYLMSSPKILTYSSLQYMTTQQPPQHYNTS